MREITGVLLILAALLGLLAIASHADTILTGFHRWLLDTFGDAWFVPVGAALALGGYLLWPKAPRPRPVDLVSGGVAVLALVGLFGLAGKHGGSAGGLIAGSVTGVVGPVGAWALLVAVLVIGLIVTIHFSPGALVGMVVGALRATYAERARLESLVTSAPPEKPKPAKAAAPTGTSDALTRSAASFATPVPALEPVRPWELDEPDEEDIRREPVLAPGLPAGEQEESPPTPGLHVVAEPEDDLPEIDWKLPSITLLDTVTARRERMADEIKRNVKIIESTLQTFGVECKVVGVNPGPAVTQYELQPGPGVQVKRITALQNDLSLALAAAPLRIEAPIPGKSAVGI